MISLDGIAKANGLLIIGQSMRDALDSIEALRRDPPSPQHRSLLANVSEAASAAMRAADDMLDRLQADAGAELTESSETMQAAAGQAMPLRILLAEDNPINRRLMAALLIREGHDVTAVEDGRRALAAITAQAFDLVLMDMQMPRLDGMSATRAIRALDPPACNTPILAISADSQPERQQIYFEGGIDSFLPKPIVGGQLLDRITRMRRHAHVPETGGDGLDREGLNLLVKQAGYEDADFVMKMLLSDLSDRPRRIGAAVQAQLWELAAGEAEALRTFVNAVGRFSLARLLASFRRHCQRRECPPAMLDELFDQARSLAAVLQQDLEAPPAESGDVADDVTESQLVRVSRKLAVYW